MHDLSYLAQKRAQGRMDREAIYRIYAAEMQAGPRIDEDGYTLIIPSVWYNENAAAFWSRYGFRFDRHTTSWKRDTRRPFTGKTYTARAWLESTRRQFFSFWTQLLADRECESCHEIFASEHRRQVYCSDCLDIVQQTSIEKGALQ